MTVCTYSVFTGLTEHYRITLTFKNRASYI